MVVAVVLSVLQLVMVKKLDAAAVQQRTLVEELHFPIEKEEEEAVEWRQMFAPALDSMRNARHSQSILMKLLAFVLFLFQTSVKKKGKCVGGIPMVLKKATQNKRYDAAAIVIRSSS